MIENHMTIGNGDHGAELTPAEEREREKELERRVTKKLQSAEWWKDKLDAYNRTKLKQSGFRWSPSIGAWQAYRNHNSMTTAQSFIPAKVQA